MTIMDFTRETLDAQHYLYVDRECAYGPEIAKAMESGFGEVFGFVGANGLQPLAMPMSVYLGMDPKILRFRAGVIVSEADAAKASRVVKSDTLPAGEVMKAVHTGAYDRLNQTHQALWKHMEDAGIPGTMPIWEIYIDDPGQVPQDEVRTEIYRTIG